MAPNLRLAGVNKEHAVTERNEPLVPDPSPADVGDPDRDSTWNTITGLTDVEEVMDEEDFTNFLIDPAPESLGPYVDRETPESTD